MDFKDLLGKLTKLNEAEMTSRKIAGKAYGGSAQDDEEDDEDGEKKAAAPAEKRGRGRPRKAGGDAQVKAGYGGAAELQKYIVGSVPKKSKELEKLGKTKHKLSDKEPTEKKKVKESLKDWIAELDQLMEAEQLSIQPAKQTQLIKQGNKVLGQVSNPQLAQQIKQSIGKGEMSLAGSELGEDSDEYSAKKARAGKDIGKPGKQFSKIAKSAGERYGSKERGEKVAGAVLAKLRAKTNEADMPPNDALASPLTLESKHTVKRDDKAEKAGKKVAKDIEYDEKVKDKIHGKKRHAEDEKAERAGKKVAKNIEYDEKKTKKVNEGMDQRIKAAHHRGKAHALAKEGYNCRYDEGSEEARMYHEGYKMGLDECYGVMPMRGVVDEGDMDIVDNMASFGARHNESYSMTEALDKEIDYDSLEVDGIDTRDYPDFVDAYFSDGYYTDGTPLPDEVLNDLGDDSDLLYQHIEKRLYEGEVEEGNAFTAALAKTPKGGKFSVGGKSFTDTSAYDGKVDEMMMAFEGWDKQLNELLTEGEAIEEGMSISVSKGQMGAPDSVSVTANDSDADKLMGLIKQMGILGGEEQTSDYGVSHADQDTIRQHGDLTVVDDHDGMMALIKKVAGPGMDQDSEDYADEMGSDDHGHDHGEVCPDCGMADCQCDGHEETCNECGGMMEAGHSCGSDKEMVDEVESEDQMEFEVAEDNAPDSDEAETSADEDAEAKEDEALAMKSISEEDEEDEEEHDGLEESFANSADDTFEADMDFMTRVISGGLNKQKSTGQTTIPVIPGQKDRMGVAGMKEGADSIMDWKKLAGLK
jgi:hypothetical protein